MCVFFFIISFYLPQSYSWSGNARHLCAPDAGVSLFCDGPACLYGVPHAEQCTPGAAADKSHPAAGKLVLAGELGFQFTLLYLGM